MVTPPHARRVWVTRTQPGASATAARLREMAVGVVVVAPVLVAQPIAGVGLELDGVDALAFTSGHALSAFAALSPRRDLPVFAVGGATAEAAWAAGFAAVRSADGDVRALAALIAETQPRPGCVLNPTAREASADLPALLAERGVGARAVVVYETLETGASVSGVDTVLVHSPRAARVLAAQLGGRPQAAGLTALAISEAAAAPLRGAGFAAVAVAPQPTEAALLDLLKG
jgi:uroporphyrinogen-III synthase